MPSLRIRLIEARNLKNKDSSSLSDPYVIFTIGKEKAKSFVVKNSLNPLWNQTFSLKVPNPSTDRLRIRVYDRDFITRDDALGSVDVNLAHLQRGVDQDMWLNLSGRRNQGQIRVSLFPQDFGTSASKPPQQPYSSSPQSHAPPQPQPQSMYMPSSYPYAYPYPPPTPPQQQQQQQQQPPPPSTYYPPISAPYQHPQQQPYHQQPQYPAPPSAGNSMGSYYPPQYPGSYPPYRGYGY